MRVYSQWWALEADALAFQRREKSDHEITVVRTTTVKALAARRFLRFVGPRKSGPGYVDSPSRAELIAGN